MTDNELMYAVKGICMKIHNRIGPGLLERVYQDILAYELSCMGLPVEKEVNVPFTYDSLAFESGFRADLIIGKRLIIEVKAVETLLPVHHAQLKTYMKLTHAPLGLLVNFNCADIFREGMYSWH